MLKDPDLIHMQNDGPSFRWNDAAIGTQLAATRHAQGLLLGRMESLGFQLRQEADLTVLTTETVQSSAIEGEKLDARQVRSSLARRLGIEEAGATPATRAVEGVVDMMLDKRVHLVINTPSGKNPREDEFKIRTAAVHNRIPIMTTLRGADAALKAIQSLQANDVQVRALQEYHG